MTWENLTDPTFVTNIITVAITIVFVALSVKQRTEIIIQKFRNSTKDKELSEKVAVIEEQRHEIEAVAKSISSMVNMLNVIAQASKLTNTDKTSILEEATANKQYIQKLVEEKEARIKNLIENTKESIQDSSQLAEALLNVGESVMDRYVQKTVE